LRIIARARPSSAHLQHAQRLRRRIDAKGLVAHQCRSGLIASLAGSGAGAQEPSPGLSLEAAAPHILDADGAAPARPADGMARRLLAGVASNTRLPDAEVS